MGGDLNLSPPIRFRIEWALGLECHRFLVEGLFKFCLPFHCGAIEARRSALSSAMPVFAMDVKSATVAKLEA